MSFLQDILNKRLAARDTTVPLSDLKQSALDTAPTRGFLNSLTSSSKLSVIAEIKFQSPREGILRIKHDVEEIARSYSAAGAKALSVLTETSFFAGSLSYLNRARNACDLPILRKDFLHDEYDIWQSRGAGADAVLLITKMLTRQQLFDLRYAASEAELDVLVELHDEDDLRKADGLHDVAWGVNHRNIETLKIDLSISERLFALFPHDSVKVAESGIKTREDLKMMQLRGANAVLIGTSLMTTSDPGTALAELLS